MKRSKKILYALFFFFFCLTGCATRDLTITRGEAYQAYQDEDYSTAVDRFEVLVKEIPGDAELWFRLGNAYAKSMRPEQAIDAYQKSLLRDPQQGKAWYNLGIIHMQTALKSFIDMQDFVNENDPIGIKGKTMRNGLLTLLGQDVDGEK